ncbi:MFS transporter [Clostridium sp. Cult3]|uniref:MFS transporter n=1 Tax=Clostridium sp. Cult3 TaxID=2079004 RepID=UPI001F3A3FB6
MDNLKALKKSVFYISFPFSLIGFLFPVYAYSKGVSIMGIGIIYSAFSLFSILMRPAVGKLIDNRGRKTGVIIGTCFYCLVNVFFLIGMDFKYLLAARICQSIAGSFYWISIDTIISDISHEGNRSENFGIINESINKGAFLGIFIGFSILLNDLFKDSFKIVFLIYLGTSLISLFYAITKVEETIQFRQTYGEEVMKKGKNFNLFLVFMGLLAFISCLTSHTYLIYVRENITDKFHLISYLFLPGAILSMFLPNKFGKISDKYSREIVLFVGMFITGILYLLIPAMKAYFYFMIMDTLIAISTMFYGPAQSALVIDIVGENQRGKAYGKYKLALGMGGIIGPIVGTYIYEHLGNTMVFYIKGILLIGICILSVIFFSKEVRYNGVKNKIV